ncbi:serine hydrolase [Croceibacterium sp. TMG7-5b_MA50]|uniref:serine hydrolase domain-containing protein n=1 Tax=Croceibacterium sp. TMG7-5b_MA50 TaxID=3121290 RepID=UPI0032221C2A
MRRLALPLACLATLLTACGAASPAQEMQAQQAGAAGLDEAAMARTLARAEELGPLNSLVILRGGETLLARPFHDGPPVSRPVNIKSASKSVMSAMIGIAIDKGVFTGVEQPVLSVLRDQAPPTPDPLLERLHIGHLLSMQAGLARTSGDNYGRWVSSPNWVRYALAQDFVARPGTDWLYSTGNTHLLSAMLTRASGRSTYDLAQEWLAGPLNIRIPQWPRDPQGIYFGGNDMLMSPLDLAAFGEMYRNGGVVDGQQIVPRDWIEASWSPFSTSPYGGDYGLGWFVSGVGRHPLYYAWGYGGQMLFILPDLQLTVVMTSDTDVERGSAHLADLRDLLANHIVPAAEAGGTWRGPGSAGISASSS